MTGSSAPEVECEHQHASLQVSDVAAAVGFYTTKLGFSLGFTWGDPPEIAGVNLGSVQMFLRRGTPSPQGCSVHFVVGNADQLFEFQRANGHTLEGVGPHTKTDLKRIAELKQKHGIDYDSHASYRFVEP